MCCAPIASRPCSDTLTVHIPTFLYRNVFYYLFVCFFSCFCTPQISVSVFLSSSECKGDEVNESWQCMCACATTTEKALCSPSFRQRCFVCCYKSMPAARCYSGSRDQVQIDQKRECIIVNGKAAFSSLQTIWWRWRLVGVQVHCSAECSTSSR